jgi:hypothetical protein
MGLILDVLGPIPARHEPVPNPYSLPILSSPPTPNTPQPPPQQPLPASAHIALN